MPCRYYVSTEGYYDDDRRCEICRFERVLDADYEDRLCDGAWGTSSVHYEFCPLKNYADSIGYSRSKKCNRLTVVQDYGWGHRLYCHCSMHDDKVNPTTMGCFGGGIFSGPACPSYRTEDDSSDGRICPITNACKRARGLLDDCRELQTIRKLRDSLKKDRADIRAYIVDYYSNAPMIVKGIEESENSQEIYEHMYEALVLPCVEAIDQGEDEKAISIYHAFFSELKRKYLGTQGV